MYSTGSSIGLDYGEGGITIVCDSILPSHLNGGDIENMTLK